MNLLMRMAGRSENPRFKGENIMQLELDILKRGCSKIGFRGSPIRFATKINTHLCWYVTGRFTCVVIFSEKSYFQEILAAMRFAKG